MRNYENFKHEKIVILNTFLTNHYAFHKVRDISKRFQVTIYLPQSICKPVSQITGVRNRVEVTRKGKTMLQKEESTVAHKLNRMRALTITKKRQLMPILLKVYSSSLLVSVSGNPAYLCPNSLVQVTPLANLQLKNIRSILYERLNQMSVETKRIQSLDGRSSQQRKLSKIH